MTTKFYSVNVEVGSYTWSVTGNDLPNDLAPAYGLADPLVIGQRWPDSQLCPNVQPEPAEATINIIAPDSTTYATLSIGDPVAVEFYPQAGFAGNVVSFYGRVATIAAKPHDLGIIYTLGCFDYTIDLQGVTVGLVDYPAERVTTRSDRICDEAGRPRIPATNIALGTGDYSSVAPRTAAGASMYDLLVPMINNTVSWNPIDWTELGTAVTVPGSRANMVPILRQNIVAKRLSATLPFFWENVVGIGRAMAYSPPLRIANVAGLQSATAAAANTSPSTGSFILDAGNVDFDTTFTQAKASGVVSQVTVSTKSTAHAAVASRDWSLWSGGPVGTVNDQRVPIPIPSSNVTAELDTDLFDSPTLVDWDGHLLAVVLLDPNRPDPKIVFDVGTLTWEAWNEPANWVVPRLGQLLTVARTAAGRNPTNREWLAGVVSSWTLRVSQGRPVVEFETMQSTNDPRLNSQQLGASNGVCRFDSPILGTTTFAQISTRDTFLDYELVRGS